GRGRNRRAGADPLGCCFWVRREGGRRLARPPGNHPLQCSSLPFSLPDEECAFYAAAQQQPATMHEGWQSHRPQLRETDAREISLAVAAEGSAEHFFGQPAVEFGKLTLIADVLQVVVNDGDITNPAFHGPRGHADQG